MEAIVGESICLSRKMQNQIETCRGTIIFSFVGDS